MAAYTLKTFADLYTAVMEELKIQSGDLTQKNRIKRIINMVYLDEVIPYTEDWKWLRGRISLSHEPYYSTGTASCTRHSTTVTLSAAPGPSKKDYYFSVNGLSEVYRIRSHTAGSTTLELEVPFVTATGTGLSFKIWTDTVVLPTECDSTFEVSHDYYDQPLDGKGYQEFKRHVKPQPKREGYPQIYSNGDFVDPVAYSSISGLPALLTRASANNVKTLVFASDVSSYLEVDDRIQITNAGHYSYNGDYIVASVSTSTITLTGTIVYNEVATNDGSLTVTLQNTESAEERYRELLIYPSIYEQRIKLDVDFNRRVKALEDDNDEPLIPMGDRIVLFYGTLAQAWASILKDPEQSARNEGKFQNKLAKMAGRIDDSTDLPQLTPSKTYLRNKRNQRRSRDTRTVLGDFTGAGGSATSSTPTGLANSVATFNNNSQLEGSSTITTTELNKLDGILSSAVGISDTQTLTNKKIDADLNTITNIENADIKSGAAIAYSKLNLANSISDSDINTAANITRSKLATGTASQVVINNGSGVLSSEAALAKSRGGTGADNSSVTFPTTGTIPTTSDKLSVFAATTSAELAGVITNETGSGSLVFGTSPTITTPTLDIPNFTEQGSTPSTPAAGTSKLYAKSDGFYRLDSSGSEVKIGTGSGGGVNYITNYDAETNTTGWVTYADAASTSPVDGTGGTANVTLTRVTSSPLRGAGMFRLTKDAANRQGQGTSYDFTIANADKAKPLNISFEYTGSTNFVAGSDSTTGDVVVYIYDVTNATLIQPAGYKLAGGTGSNWKYSGYFQTAYNSTSYRLIIHVAATHTNAWTFDIDNVKVGPDAQINGTVITDWTTFTPTGSWVSNTTYTGQWRRMGGDMEIFYRVALSGAPTAATLTLNLPSGYSIDTTRIPSTTQGNGLDGVAHLLDTGNSDSMGRPAYNSATAIQVQQYNGSTVNSTAPWSWGSTDGLEVFVKVPISGWGSTVTMSNDTDTRVVAFYATKNGNLAISAGGTPQATTWTTVNDTHGAFVSDTYTIPVAGYYRVGFYSLFSGNTNGQCYYAINGGSNINIGAYTTLIFGGGDALTQYLKAGDQIKWYVFSSNAVNLSTGANSYITVHRLAGPATIAASETVTASYNHSAGQSIPNGTQAIVDFANKDWDSHGAVTTGSGWKFTAPISGTYQVNSMVLFSGAGSFTSGTKGTLYLYKGGSSFRAIGRQFITTTAGQEVTPNGGTQIKLLAGEYIDIRVDHGESSARSLLASAPTFNHVSIVRVGNY